MLKNALKEKHATSIFSLKDCFINTLINCTLSNENRRAILINVWEDYSINCCSLGINPKTIYEEARKKGKPGIQHKIIRKVGKQEIYFHSWMMRTFFNPE